MSKETAVEWLINELTVIDFTDPFWKEKIEQAKEMEKQQMIKFANDFLFLEDTDLTAEQYYNKTYKK